MDSRAKRSRALELVWAFLYVAATCAASGCIGLTYVGSGAQTAPRSRYQLTAPTGDAAPRPNHVAQAAAQKPRQGSAAATPDKANDVAASPTDEHVVEATHEVEKPENAEGNDAAPDKTAVAQPPRLELGSGDSPRSIDDWLARIEGQVELSEGEIADVRQSLNSLQDDFLRGMFVARYLADRVDTSARESKSEPTSGVATDAKPDNQTAKVETKEPDQSVAATAQTAAQATADEDVQVQLRALLREELERFQQQSPAPVVESLATDARLASIENSFAAAAYDRPANRAESVRSASNDVRRSADDDWREQVVLAAADLRKEISRGRLPPAEENALQGRLALLLLAAGEEDEAVRAVQSGSHAAQDFWRRETFALASLLEGDAELSPERITGALRDLQRASRSLAAEARLDVRNLAFCRKATSYGVYEPFPAPGDAFHAGQEVILYSEVENFVSRPTADGEFHTRLSARCRILDDDGRRVDDQPLGEVDETCRNYRRDFFIPFRLRLPSTLSPGPYTLELEIEDIEGEKTGVSSIPFRIGD